MRPAGTSHRCGWFVQGGRCETTRRLVGLVGGGTWGGDEVGKGGVRGIPVACWFAKLKLDERHNLLITFNHFFIFCEKLNISRQIPFSKYPSASFFLVLFFNGIICSAPPDDGSSSSAAAPSPPSEEHHQILDQITPTIPSIILLNNCHSCQQFQICRNTKREIGKTFFVGIFCGNKCRPEIL